MQDISASSAARAASGKPAFAWAFRSRPALTSLIAAAGVSAALSLSAWAAPDQPPEPHPGHHMDMPFGHEEMPFAGRHFDHLLDEAKASDAQKQQIHQIMAKAFADLKPLHEQGRALHEQALKLWAASTIDPTAAEKLRQQMLAQHDQASKRMTQAMIDVGNVLSPEQRATVAQAIQKHHEDMMQRLKDHLGNWPGAKHHGEPASSAQGAR